MINACPVRITEPYAHTYRVGVRPTDAGQTLVQLLSSRFPYLPKGEWERRIEEGLVKVDGVLGVADQVLAANSEVRIHQEWVIEPSVPDAVRVHYASDDWLVVEKPAPMPVHSGGRYHRNTLVHILSEMGYPDLKTVHRLDAVTSGLILLARTAAFAEAVGQAFNDGSVEKTYYALVDRQPKEDEFTIDRPIFRSLGFMFDTGNGPGARDALTHFQVAKRYENGALVRCMPVTGRTHQLRLHLRDAGCAITGDQVYQPGGQTRIQNRPIALFSSELKLPTLDLHWTIPYPESWNGPEGLAEFR